jgi:hypothetical protein
MQQKQDELSNTMRAVLNHLEADLRPLVKQASGVWSTAPDAGWNCTTGTVTALAKRGLIRELDDARTRYILTSPDGFQAQMQRMIRATAHEIATARQDGDELGHWLEAEKRLLGHAMAVAA